MTLSEIIGDFASLVSPLPNCRGHCYVSAHSLLLVLCGIREGWDARIILLDREAILKRFVRVIRDI